MACHEIAALRLGLMRVLGHIDEAERQHERAELGAALDSPGPIASLAEATDIHSLKRFYESACAALEERIARTAQDDVKLPYLRTLLVLTRKVELELQRHTDMWVHFYRDLEAMHDFVHAIYPAED